jgi:hypothetical protein
VICRSRGTGTITIDTSKISNPGTTFQAISPFVTAFSLTITGATSGNGTFGFSDFDGGTSVHGGFIISTATTIDYTKDLAPQVTDFNIFTNHTDVNAPTGSGTQRITTDNGIEDPLSLTSFAPAAVPEPSTAIVSVIGSVAFLAYGRSRQRRAQRRQAAA